MLSARSKGLPFTRRPIIVKCPLAKRKALSRVVVKENRRSVQWRTLRTRSSRKALMVLWKIDKVEKPAGGQARSRPLRRPVWPSVAQCGPIVSHPGLREAKTAVAGSKRLRYIRAECSDCNIKVEQMLHGMRRTCKPWRTGNGCCNEAMEIGPPR